MSYYFVLCPEYHGSQLLSLLLNNHSQVLCLGDTNPVVSPSPDCSCGKTAAECEFWQQLEEETYDGGSLNSTKMFLEQPNLFNNEFLNKTGNALFSWATHETGINVWQMFEEPAAQFRELHEAFTSSLDYMLPHDVFVDAERSIFKFTATSSLELPVDGVIHITRDPRGYVMERISEGEETHTDLITYEWNLTHKRILKWTNIFSEIPVLQIKYEDMLEHPETIMEKIFSFLGLENEDVLHAPKNDEKNHVIGKQSLITGFDGTMPEAWGWKYDIQPSLSKKIVTDTRPLFNNFEYRM